MHISSGHKGSSERHVELQMHRRYIIRGWPHMREALEPGAEKYWLIRHEFTMTDGIKMKDKHVSIPYLL